MARPGRVVDGHVPDYAFMTHRPEALPDGLQETVSLMPPSGAVYGGKGSAMRTRLLLILILLFVTAATHAQEADPALLEVAGVTLRLRSGPSTDDAILDTLRPGTALELLERGEQWSQVRRQDGLTGWAHNDYLLPWDERNRPDAHRRVGEQRLFRVYSGQQRYAELRLGQRAQLPLHCRPSRRRSAA